jgi:hypothetical protein
MYITALKIYAVCFIISLLIQLFPDKIIDRDIKERILVFALWGALVIILGAVVSKITGL